MTHPPSSAVHADATSDAVLVSLASASALEPVKQVFGSAYFNGRWKGAFCLLAADVPKDATGWFADRGIHVRHCTVRAAPTTEVAYPVGLCKGEVFSDWFRRFRHVVFLDWDVIVRQPLTELATVSGFAAVLEALGGTFVGQLAESTYGRSLMERRPDLAAGLKAEFDVNVPAFNAGIFAFDTSVIAEGAAARFEDIVARYVEIFWLVDQPVLNLCFHKAWSQLPRRWNQPAGRAGIMSNTDSAAILHFQGPRNKPWRPEYASTRKFEAEWHYNRARAEFIHQLTVDGHARG